MIDNRKKCPELPAVRIYPDFPYSFTAEGLIERSGVTRGLPNAELYGEGNERQLCIGNI